MGMVVSKPQGFESLPPRKSDPATPRPGLEERVRRDPLSERRSVVVPSWYSPALHLLALLSTAAFAVAMLWRHASLAEVRPWAWLALPAAIVLANGLEYVIHRFPMHKRTKQLDRLFVRHTISHHRWFTHKRMEVVSLRELYMVFFQVELVVIVLLVAGLSNLATRLTLGADVGAIFCSGLMTYWLALELVHAATHLPESWYQHRPFRGPVLRYLRAFHRAHHDPKLMRQGNFNVTFPFWDFIFGTALPVMSADSLDEGSEPLVTEPA